MVGSAGKGWLKFSATHQHQRHRYASDWNKHCTGEGDGVCLGLQVNNDSMIPPRGVSYLHGRSRFLVISRHKCSSLFHSLTCHANEHQTSLQHMRSNTVSQVAIPFARLPPLTPACHPNSSGEIWWIQNYTPRRRPPWLAHGWMILRWKECHVVGWKECQVSRSLIWVCHLSIYISKSSAFTEIAWIKSFVMWQNILCILQHTCSFMVPSTETFYIQPGATWSYLDRCYLDRWYLDRWYLDRCYLDTCYLDRCYLDRCYLKQMLPRQMLHTRKCNLMVLEHVLVPEHAQKRKTFFFTERRIFSIDFDKSRQADTRKLIPAQKRFNQSS